MKNTIDSCVVQKFIQYWYSVSDVANNAPDYVSLIIKLPYTVCTRHALVTEL